MLPKSEIATSLFVHPGGTCILAGLGSSHFGSAKPAVECPGHYGDPTTRVACTPVHSRISVVWAWLACGHAISSSSRSASVALVPLASPNFGCVAYDYKVGLSKLIAVPKST